MSEVNMKATRVSYGEAITELGREHPDIVVLDADLSSATKTELFRKEFPDRHIQCGVAEQNMMNVAAGLSTTGLVPFASTFAMFAAGRAFEMVRNTIGYGHLNVKIGATHGGISVGEDGASHQCCEDFALMRSIPGMTVLCPADDIEAKEMVKAAYAHTGPVYLRFSRAPSPLIHGTDYTFAIGKGEILHEGSDAAVITAGLPAAECLKAAKMLAEEGIGVRVVNMGSIKPIDEELIVRCAAECGRILTVEEHTIIGGLGEAVCGVTAEHMPVPVKRLGIRDKFGHSGSARDLLEEYGLTAGTIAEEIRAFLDKTKEQPAAGR